jgi:molybdopterin molybdotransferase
MQSFLPKNPDRRRNFRPMISPLESLAIVLENVAPLPAVRLPLKEGVWRVLAGEIRADRDLPPADRSAMDGYAVRAADLASCPATLRLVGEVAAGSRLRPRVRPGTCVRILTGANVPPGADAVVMVEQTRAEEDRVTFLAAPAPGENILRRAENARKGAVLVPEGTVLTASAIGAAAASGHDSVNVRGLPRVTVLCTGAELRRVGDPVGVFQERNSNGPMLCAALAAWGFRGCNHATLPDNLDVQTRRIRQAVERYDVVLVVGGVSVGKYDYVSRAVEAAGGRRLFHGVAMKPGKPILMARFGGGAVLFGLPGNPLSAMVGFHELVLPALRRLSGAAVGACRPAIYASLATALSLKGGTVRHMLARIAWRTDGPAVEPVASLSSADLVAGGKADGTIVLLPQTKKLRAGARVEFRPWRPLP